VAEGGGLEMLVPTSFNHILASFEKEKKRDFLVISHFTRKNIFKISSFF